MTTFEHRRRALLWQMLPHTMIGHPVASALTALGLHSMADGIHYATLPLRAKRRLGWAKPAFNPDQRLWSMDIVFTPLCSLARALGLYRVADWIFRRGPHELATALGACSYYYDRETATQRRRRQEEERAAHAEDERISSTLKRAGYTVERCRRKGTSILLPWVWVAPAGHNPTAKETELMDLSGHYLKGPPEDNAEYEFEA